MKKHFCKNFFLNSLFKLRREFNHSEFEIWFDYSVIESIYDIFPIKSIIFISWKGKYIQ